jgi:hypothetical protein
MKPSAHRSLTRPTNEQASLLLLLPPRLRPPQPLQYFRPLRPNRIQPIPLLLQDLLPLRQDLFEPLVLRFVLLRLELEALDAIFFHLAVVLWVRYEEEGDGGAVCAGGCGGGVAATDEGVADAGADCAGCAGWAVGTLKCPGGYAWCLAHRMALYGQLEAAEVFGEGDFFGVCLRFRESVLFLG